MVREAVICREEGTDRGLPPPTQEPCREWVLGLTRSAATQGGLSGDLGFRGQRPHQGSSEVGEATQTPFSPPSWKPAPADPRPWKPGGYFYYLLLFSPLFWVLVATFRLSLVVAIRGYSLL